jgi:hypothetical protein
MAKKSTKKAETTSAEENSSNKAMSLKTLTKSTVWDVQENDIFRMLETAEKDAEIKENLRHFADIIRSAFLIEEVKEDDKATCEKLTKQDYKIGTINLGDNAKLTWAIKKRPIMRVTDLTYENIRHISAAKLIEVLDRNFGGGWDSLSQSIQDIIESGFDISTTTLPKDRLHKKGGMYEKKVADGYEVLEVEKGSWVEAIFAKLKPEVYKPRMKFDSPRLGDEDEDEDMDLPEDDYNKPDEDDMEIEEPNDDEINEDNYRTTFVIEDNSDDDAESLSDFIADE